MDEEIPLLLAGKAVAVSYTHLFADMLEHKRIQEACKLLVRKEYQIKEIAAMAGYSSDTSFRRAFKRVMGVSPGEYSQ